MRLLNSCDKDKIPTIDDAFLEHRENSSFDIFLVFRNIRQLLTLTVSFLLIDK